MIRSVELSVVVPLYNEAAVLEQLVRTLRDTLEPLGRTFELVLVDDGSSDGTGELLCGSGPPVVPVLLSRNFGKEAAILAGLSAATGRAVVLMDGDLQHPPSVIPGMLELWDRGFEVVNAVKADRGRESWLYRIAAAVFYRLLGRALGEAMRGQSDFKLLDRRVVSVLVALPERRRFFRALVVWIGFRTTSVPFQVAPRAAGRTSWSLLGLVSYAVYGLVSFSSVPLHAIAWVGGGVTVGAALLAAHTFWRWSTGTAISGFTTVILATLGIGGAILISLGVIATYLAAIYDEIKQRPVYLLRPPSEPRKDGGRAPVSG
jgi:polyisoprenyl-phosphate glycosyltransferase